MALSIPSLIEELSVIMDMLLIEKEDTEKGAREEWCAFKLKLLVSVGDDYDPIEHNRLWMALARKPVSSKTFKDLPVSRLLTIIRLLTKTSDIVYDYPGYIVDFVELLESDLFSPLWGLNVLSRLQITK